MGGDGRTRRGDLRDAVGFGRKKHTRRDSDHVANGKRPRAAHGGGQSASASAGPSAATLTSGTGSSWQKERRMSTPESLPFDSPDHLRKETEELRRGVLPLLMAPLVAAPVLWLVYTTAHEWSSGAVDLAALQLIVCLMVAYRWRERRYAWACATFTASLAIGVALVLTVHPQPLIMAFGVLVVPIAYALLGPRQSLVAGFLSWSGSLAAMAAGGGAPSLESAAGSATLYALMWGVSSAAGRPFRTSVVWALNGWERARRSLAQTQERRAELYRALRALEEATYRIERMNSELLLAWHVAEEARSQKERFVATVSHELRGPLNLILGYAQLIVMSPESYDVPLPASYRADVATIFRNTQHLADLVDDVLDLAQVEAHKLPLARETIDLARDVIAEAVDLVGPLAERKGLHLRQELGQDVPVVLADRVRLRQVVVNLLTNAVRFTEKGGIVVRARCDGESVVVSVADTGPGIPPESIALLFREFSQAHMSQSLRSRAERGSGLGLAICRHLVDLHGGRIWVESQPGVGTTFHFSIPLESSTPSAETGLSTEDKRTPQGECYVLVHGHSGIMRLLGRHLERRRVVGVGDLDALTALTRELHPQAIITVPDQVERVRSRVYALHDVPVISLPTAQDAPLDDREEGVQHMTKPLTPYMLNVALQRLPTATESTLLLVDDDPDFLRLMDRMLALLPRPLRILYAQSGAQALSVMSDVTPDLVFMDLVMPEMDGWQTIAHMRRHERLRAVPIVLVSAHDPSEGNVQLSTPISLYCEQPLSAARAMRCVSALLEALDEGPWPQPTPGAGS
jgi:signal transduction histidine kinase/CheY-like chemotaxis protein